MGEAGRRAGGRPGAGAGTAPPVPGRASGGGVDRRRLPPRGGPDLCGGSRDRGPVGGPPSGEQGPGPRRGGGGRAGAVRCPHPLRPPGGANDLAREIAGLLGGQAVLTTATDARGIFSFDQWACRLGCAIPDPEKIRPVASQMLAGGDSGLLVPVAGGRECPSGSGPGGAGGGPGPLTIRDTPEPALKLVPRIVWAGIGCRRGVRRNGWRRPSAPGWRRRGSIQPRWRGCAPSTARGRSPACWSCAAGAGCPAHLFPGGAEPGGGGVYPSPSSVRSPGRTTDASGRRCWPAAARCC